MFETPKRRKMNVLLHESETSVMKPWGRKAITLLERCLTPPKQECNEVDWKVALSDDKARVSEHLCAMANHPGGGYLAFGVRSDSTLQGITLPDIEKIANRLTNLGRDAVEPSIQIDHEGLHLFDSDLLLVHINESHVKPVHLRGRPETETFIRSGATTRKASRQEVGSMMLHSKNPRWEDLRASVLLSDDEVLETLNVDDIFRLLDQKVPQINEEKLKWMHEANFIERQASGGAYITNLGAITAAKDLVPFSSLAGKPARVAVYEGVSKAKLRDHREGQSGYALTFENLMNHVNRQLPTSEEIGEALRKKVSLYPPLALREIIANALIHQDFTISGRPLIEIFDDRIEISNPGVLLPSKTIERIIGTQPLSRNEKLAKDFRRYGICEQLGSGLIKAAQQMEAYGLPPIKFEQEGDYFKVTLLGPRTFAQMNTGERLLACYQHAIIRHCSGTTMTNKSLRERLKMPEKQRSMVSVLIQEALDRSLIAPSNPLNKSRKLSEYVPYWAAQQPRP